MSLDNGTPRSASPVESSETTEPIEASAITEKVHERGQDVKTTIENLKDLNKDPNNTYNLAIFLGKLSRSGVKFQKPEKHADLVNSLKDQLHTGRYSSDPVRLARTLAELKSIKVRQRVGEAEEKKQQIIGRGLDKEKDKELLLFAKEVLQSGVEAVKKVRDKSPQDVQDKNLKLLTIYTQAKYAGIELEGKNSLQGVINFNDSDGSLSLLQKARLVARHKYVGIPTAEWEKESEAFIVEKALESVEKNDPEPGLYGLVASDYFPKEDNQLKPLSPDQQNSLFQRVTDSVRAKISNFVGLTAGIRGDFQASEAVSANAPIESDKPFVLDDDDWEEIIQVTEEPEDIDNRTTASNQSATPTPDSAPVPQPLSHEELTQQQKDLEREINEINKKLIDPSVTNKAELRARKESLRQKKYSQNESSAQTAQATAEAEEPEQEEAQPTVDNFLDKLAAEAQLQEEIVKMTVEDRLKKIRDLRQDIYAATQGSEEFDTAVEKQQTYMFTSIEEMKLEEGDIISMESGQTSADGKVGTIKYTVEKVEPLKNDSTQGEIFLSYIDPNAPVLVRSEAKFTFKRFLAYQDSITNIKKKEKPKAPASPPPPAPVEDRKNKKQPRKNGQKKGRKRKRQPQTAA